jgi:hypothetical protein
MLPVALSLYLIMSAASHIIASCMLHWDTTHDNNPDPLTPALSTVHYLTLILNYIPYSSIITVVLNCTFYFDQIKSYVSPSLTWVT